MALDYLPSPGWAVIYGETPSATRWSELGDNDDALATGAGIDDLAILARHIATGVVVHGKMTIPFETTAGKNGSFIRLGKTVLCFGENSIANAGTTLNLPVTYTGTPVCYTTTHDPSNWSSWVASKTTTTIQLKQAYTTAPLLVNWLTIGQVA